MTLTESSEAIRACDYKPRPRQFLKKIEQRGKARYTTYLCERWISLDTETAWNHDEQNPVGWVYQWAFKFGDEIVVGRTPTDFVESLIRIEKALDLGKDRRLIIFVHNLSYDIQYLKQALMDAYGTPNMLAIKPHKFITFEIGPYVFRCSYKLSNKSLATWANDLGTEHKKLAEEKAYYDEIHYPDDELTTENWRYQIRDAIVLDECIEKQLAAYGDTLLTLPLTSTGYVRREARKNYKKDRRNRKRFIMTALNVETYEACREAFAGGITHGDRFLAGKTIRPDREKGEHIWHGDFWSHYPSQQRVKSYPVGRFNLYGEHISIGEVKNLVKDYCVLMQIVLKGVRVRDGVTLPYISVSKAYKGRLEKLNMIEDNGRALEIKGAFALHVTELDLHWILRQYNIDSYDIAKAWIAVKGAMPAYMMETVDTFYKGKTRWKMALAEGKAKPNPDKEKIIYLSLELMKSKNGLNGIYGMSATDPVRISYEMDERGEWSTKAPDTSEALAKYYASEKSFNRYQLGVYCTANARYELLEFAEIITKHGGRPIYVDTDSIFYIGTDEVKKAIDAENEKRRQKAYDNGWFIEVDGKKVHYDCFADEGEDIDAFRFLHAKCYAYEVGGELKCTIAGVTQFEDATHAFSREDELGGIDELKKGKVFERCGGTKALYTETPRAVVRMDGHTVEVGAACIITPTTKTLKSEVEQYETMFDWEVDENDGIF